jgi:transposase-like protein
MLTIVFRISYKLFVKMRQDKQVINQAIYLAIGVYV